MTRNAEPGDGRDGAAMSKIKLAFLPVIRILTARDSRNSTAKMCSFARATAVQNGVTIVDSGNRIEQAIRVRWVGVY
jgi:hypothetical protein